MIQIFISPSSEQEKDYENCATLKECVELTKFEDGDALYNFKSIDEVNAFITGYEAAIGYNGNGFYTLMEISPENDKERV